MRYKQVNSASKWAGHRYGQQAPVSIIGRLVLTRYKIENINDDENKNLLQTELTFQPWSEQFTKRIRGINDESHINQHSLVRLDDHQPPWWLEDSDDREVILLSKRRFTIKFNILVNMKYQKN